MQTALEALVGPEAKGLSLGTVSQQKQRWAGRIRRLSTTPLEQGSLGLHLGGWDLSGLRADDQCLYALVVIGVNERGEKHFLVIEDGVRESTQSWREVLLGLKHRGLKAPKLAVGDGALGFWAALNEVFSETRRQPCWMHKTDNLLNTLQKTVQPKAKRALHDIWQAATKVEAEAAFDAFVETYEPKYPKAVMALVKDREVLGHAAPITGTAHTGRGRENARNGHRTLTAGTLTKGENVRCNQYGRADREWTEARGISAKNRWQYAYTSRHRSPCRCGYISIARLGKILTRQ